MFVECPCECAHTPLRHACRCVRPSPATAALAAQHAPGAATFHLSDKGLSARPAAAAHADLLGLDDDGSDGAPRTCMHAHTREGCSVPMARPVRRPPHPLYARSSCTHPFGILISHASDGAPHTPTPCMHTEPSHGSDLRSRAWELAGVCGGVPRREGGVRRCCCEGGVPRREGGVRRWRWEGGVPRRETAPFEHRSLFYSRRRGGSGGARAGQGGAQRRAQGSGSGGQEAVRRARGAGAPHQRVERIRHLPRRRAALRARAHAPLPQRVLVATCPRSHFHSGSS